MCNFPPVLYITCTLFFLPRQVTSPTPSVESSNADPIQVSDSSFLMPTASGSRISSSLRPSKAERDSCESCIYVLPNTSIPNDGFKLATSWGLESGFVMNELLNDNELTANTCVVIRELSRVEAEKCLKKCGIVGCFLFRNTSNGICLSVLAPDQKCRHLVVDHINNSSYKIKSLPTGSECFASLEDFVEFYSDNEVHFQDGGFSVKLSQLCN